MRKTTIGLGVVLICGVGVGIWFFSGDGVIVGRDENQDDIAQEVGLWSSGATIAQTFIASQNQLTRLDFALKSYHPWDVPYLECRLFEIQTAERPDALDYAFITAHRKEIRYKRINGWLLSGHMFNRFRFAPIPDSQGKRYLLTIEAPVVKTGGSSILLASSKERYEYGNLFVDGAKQAIDLGFRALYQESRLRLLRKMAAKVALQKPFPFSSPRFYYGLGVIYFSALASLLIVVLRQDSRR